MRRFVFNIEVSGCGECVEDAWENAADDLYDIAHAIKWDNLDVPEKYKEFNEED